MILWERGGWWETKRKITGWAGGQKILDVLLERLRLDVSQLLSTLSSLLYYLIDFVHYLRLRQMGI